MVPIKERLSKIREYLMVHGEVKLDELEKLFPHVSSMTLRRDLKRLENTGDIVITRNGAKSIEYLSKIKEELYCERVYENVAAKAQIAQKALPLIEQGSTIFLDSGTTLATLAMLITNKKLLIVTAAPNIALECAKLPDVKVLVSGGYLNSDNLSLSGANALSFLEDININIAFLGTTGYSRRNGFTCGNFDECQIKKKVISKANSVAMLMDNTKLNRELPFTFAHVSDIDYLILEDNSEMSDAGEQFAECKEYKIEVL